MKRIILLVIALIIILIGLSFALVNAENVKLNFYIGSFEAPLSLVVVLSMVVGAVIGVLASLGMVLRHKREIHRLKRSVKMTEKELENLRALPLKDRH